MDSHLVPHSPKLSELGENAVVERLLQIIPTSSPSIVLGPGDDCAVVQVAGQTRHQLLKTDAVVEGVHFLANETMERVGWKALCRALSDIAAMGGTPEHALLTVLAPRQTDWSRLEGLYRGIGRAARQFGVSVVGGETGHTTGPLVCNVCLTGWVSPEHCVSRSGGRPGDVLLVTGKLGGSFESGKHLDFIPRLAEAEWLVTHFCPNAMMDLSDGLGADLPRLAAASRCAYRIDRENVPRTPGTTVEQALSDGEDFELLLAMAPGRVGDLMEAWSRRFPLLPLTVVGELVSGSGGETLSASGYDHFQES